MTTKKQRTVTFTGEEIIQALLPAIGKKLLAEEPGDKGQNYNIVQTRWETRLLPRRDAPLRPGTIPMTVDVVFTLEREPEKDPS